MRVVITTGLLVAGIAIILLEGRDEPESPPSTLQAEHRTAAAPDGPPDRDVGTSTCDADDRGERSTTTAPFGEILEPAPRAMAGAHLFDLGNRTFALKVEGPPSFAEFRPSTGTWTCLADAPVAGPLTAVPAASGQLLVVSGSAAALYDGSTDGWTDLPLPDDVSGPPVGGVWTGTSFVLVWPSPAMDVASRVAALAPNVGTWTDLADPPFQVNRTYNTTVAWTGSDVVVFGTWLDGSNHPAAPNAQLARYDVERDAWEQLPTSPLSAHAADLVTVGEQLFAVDYTQQTARFDLATASWSGPDETSLAPSECVPQLAASQRHVTVVACTQAAILDVPTGRWSTLSELSTRSPVSFAGVIGDRSYLWWSPDERADGYRWQLVAIDPTAS